LFAAAEAPGEKKGGKREGEKGRNEDGGLESGAGVLVSQTDVQVGGKKKKGREKKSEEKGEVRQRPALALKNRWQALFL